MANFSPFIKEEIMAIKKEYSQNNAECRVTFQLDKEIASNFNQISVVGDFNNWSSEITSFSETDADGLHSATIILPANNSYQFRYLADGVHWFNDSEADDEVDSYFAGFKNSIINI